MITFFQVFSTGLLLREQNLSQSTRLSEKDTEVFLTDRLELPFSLDAAKSYFRKFPKELCTLQSRKTWEMGKVRSIR